MERRGVAVGLLLQRQESLMIDHVEPDDLLLRCNLVLLGFVAILKAQLQLELLPW